MKQDLYNYPPRGMNRETAARYVGLGATKFDQMVIDGRMPKPKRIDGRVVWDRLSLDAAFDDLDAEPTNLIDEILARRVVKKPPQSGG
jgi:predicted DNA-binding transcriptional regulator AlpA